ncbi:MAG: carbamoyl phosphate synthase small subunit, partial [Lachnospiraceae bacterium]|nr:carbamoyl phosphate synthase small subunit [Lachnospiraceae bacterium]
EDGTMFSVQYHPESAPGPQDSGFLFERFTDMMRRFKDAKEN